MEEDKSHTLEGLLGQRVTFWCLNYIYTGELAHIRKGSHVTLKDAAVVYETGPFDDPNWLDAQKLPHPINVMLRCVEAFMVLK